MINNPNTKQKLYKYCLEFIDARLQTVQNQIVEIQNSLLSETKSSSGDKHETGRAMLQLEREKAGQQLAEIQKLNEIISKIDINKAGSTISLGSLIITSKANYFIAISAGEIRIENIDYYCISANTPIGQLLIGKTKGDNFSFRDLKFEINEVL